MHAPSFVADLAVVLLVASGTAMLFRALGQSSVLGYLVAGLIVGPYIPIPVFADAERTHALSELGVVLVMFVVGLELRVRRLLAVLPTAGVTAIVEVASLMGCGYAIGRAIGWDVTASVFLGASIGISSTMLVSKVFEERSVSGAVREHVMSVLVLQDVLAIVLAAVLTAVAAGQGLSAGDLGLVVGRLGGVLLGIVALGLLVVPRLVRAVVRTKSGELLVVVCVALCFGLALLAESLGYSVALGAFLAGVLVAESGSGAEVEHRVEPLRDVFAAIFFVAIGMTVDPRLALEHAGTSFGVFIAVVLAQLLSVSVAGVLSGNGLDRSVRAGLSLGQVGEFGFILSAIGIGAGVAPPELAPIVVSVAVLTAFTTPLAVRASTRVVRAIDHALPRRLQDLLSLYESWFEELTTSMRPATLSVVRRIALVLAVDGLALSALLLGATLGMAPLRALARAHLGLAAPLDRYSVIALAVVLAAVPLVSFLRATRALGAHVAEVVFGPRPVSVRGRPRRVLEVAVQLLVLLAVGVPCVVLVTPFTGPWSLAGFAVAVAAIASLLWQTAGRVAPQVRSSAAHLVDLLAAQTSEDAPAHEDSPGMLGMASVSAVPLDAGAHAIDKTLTELDLRALTSATVVAIRSADAEHRLPTGREVLRQGDVLAVTGSSRAIELARALLLRGELPTTGEDEPVEAPAA